MAWSDALLFVILMSVFPKNHNSDWYDYYEFTKEHTNPTGPDLGLYAVRRGGAFNNDEWFGRASARGATYRPEPYIFLGFRLAL